MEHMRTIDPFDLARFRMAQSPLFPTVLAELHAGRKRTHWMWFIFPQLRGLGRSSTARLYAISSLQEAQAYLQDPVLGDRLKLATAATLALSGSSANAIFGSPDDLKFHSSMTLFSIASGDAGSSFHSALDQYFSGQLDPQTLDLLRR